MPAGAAARLLRRRTRGLRQLRHLPGAAGVVGRHGRRRRSCSRRCSGCSASATRSSAPGSASTSCWASKTDKVVQFRHDELTRVRRRHRPARGRVARGGPPAARAGAARGRGRLRHAGAHRRQRGRCCAGERTGDAAPRARAPGRAAKAAKSARRPPPPSCPTRPRRCSSGCGPGAPATAKEQGVPGVCDLPRRDAAADRHARPDDARRAGDGSAASARPSSPATASSPRRPRRELSPLALVRRGSGFPSGRTGPGGTSAAIHSPSTATASRAGRLHRQVGVRDRLLHRVAVAARGHLGHAARRRPAPAHRPARPPGDRPGSGTAAAAPARAATPRPRRTRHPAARRTQPGLGGGLSGRCRSPTPGIPSPAAGSRSPGTRAAPCGPVHQRLPTAPRRTPSGSTAPTPARRRT